jgi:hypothetical protein
MWYLQKAFCKKKYSLKTSARETRVRITKLDLSIGETMSDISWTI